MAKFTLTEAHVKAIIDPMSNGDLSSFIAAIDPNVRWVIGIRWMEEVATPLKAKLAGIAKHQFSSLDVIGNTGKANFESSAEGMQANGNLFHSL
ncbi:hypothetical protein B0H11DRAFT_2240025 [Mycena galericulata]|nr:hypothetical protein B0H11DRAFT_2240025 [Mycena galericulata]